MEDRPDNTADASQTTDGRCVTLRRAGHRWVFRYAEDSLAELRLTLRDLALDPNTPFDRVDAALFAHRASAGPVSGLATKIKTTTTVRGATGPGDQSRGTAR